MHGKSTSHRTRYMVMLDEDIAKFSDLLAEAFPQARYYMEPTTRQTNYLYHDESDNPLRTRPPRLLMHASMHRIWRATQHWEHTLRPATICMVPDPKWKPEWGRQSCHDEEYPPYWVLWSPPFPFVEFRQPKHTGPYQDLDGAVTTLDSRGDMITHSQPGNKEHQRFDRQITRLLDMVTSGRNLVEVVYPSGKILQTFVGKYSWARVGHAARRWATENGDGFLSFSRDNRGFYSGIKPLPQDYEARLKQSQSILHPAAADKMPASDAAPAKTGTARQKRNSYLTAWVALVEEDIMQFSALLAEAFPDARYYMEPTDRQCNNPYRDSRDNPVRTRPPRLLIHRSLHRVWKVSRRWQQNTIWMVADPQWEPVWEQRPHYAKDTPPYWSLPGPPKPYAEFKHIGHSYTDGSGAITALYERSFISTGSPVVSEAYPKFESRFFRALDKVAGKLNMIRVEYPSGKIIDPFVDGYLERRVGHAARRWAAEDNTHFLSFDDGCGLRPLPDDQARA